MSDGMPGQTYSACRYNMVWYGIVPVPVPYPTLPYHTIQLRADKHGKWKRTMHAATYFVDGSMVRRRASTILS